MKPTKDQLSGKHDRNRASLAMSDEEHGGSVSNGVEHFVGELFLASETPLENGLCIFRRSHSWRSRRSSRGRSRSGRRRRRRRKGRRCVGNWGRRWRKIGIVNATAAECKASKGGKRWGRGWCGSRDVLESLQDGALHHARALLQVRSLALGVP